MLVFHLQAVIFTLLQLSYEPRTGPVPYTSLFYSDTSAAITQFNLLETSKVLDEKKSYNWRQFKGTQTALMNQKGYFDR